MAIETICPLCGSDSVIVLRVDDECDTFECSECSDEFDADWLEAVIESHSRLLRVSRAARSAMHADEAVLSPDATAEAG